jgi:hypothetical protein
MTPRTPARRVVGVGTSSVDTSGRSDPRSTGDGAVVLLPHLGIQALRVVVEGGLHPAGEPVRVIAADIAARAHRVSR